MFKCTGICNSCGKCKDSLMMKNANERKIKMITYPADFSPDELKTDYGVAFDIGTTTIVGMLWDLSQGKQIGVSARTNPQNEFGMDVISRINFCGQAKENLGILHNKVCDCLNDIIKELCQHSGINSQKIIKAAVCGNTTMSHLFAGYTPDSLARAPFDPAYKGTLKLDAYMIGLDMSSEGLIWVIPNIAGHVGGDITAGLVACRFLDNKDITLFIDIGTNGELVLTDGIRTVACSTAAGPAFEGASIRFGMRAAEGAIERVMITDDEVIIKTIGDYEPQGICGSGLIDAIAQMLDNGLINNKGRMLSADDIDKMNLSENFKDLLVNIEGERAFILTNKDDGSPIVITQNDIREVQLAKGAISAGINLMLEELKKELCDVKKVVVAGAFGNYIDKRNAVRIGLLPNIDQDNIISAGNTAGAGISMAMLSRAERELAESIPQLVQHIDLAELENFQKTYMKAMGFHDNRRE